MHCNTAGCQPSIGPGSKITSEGGWDQWVPISGGQEAGLALASGLHETARVSGRGKGDKVSNRSGGLEGAGALPRRTCGL